MSTYYRGELLAGGIKRGEQNAAYRTVFIEVATDEPQTVTIAKAGSATFAAAPAAAKISTKHHKIINRRRRTRGCCRSAHRRDQRAEGFMMIGPARTGATSGSDVPVVPTPRGGEPGRGEQWKAGRWQKDQDRPPWEARGGTTSSAVPIRPVVARPAHQRRQPHRLLSWVCLGYGEAVGVMNISRLDPRVFGAHPRE